MNEETQIQPASEFHRPWQMNGEDETDSILPRVIIHQGDISEKEYGHHPKGTLLDSVTLTPLTSNRFVPIGIAWKEWFKWGGRGQGLVYKVRNVNEVPPEDLVWQGKEPPTCTLYRNFALIFEGSDTPVCLSLKDSMPLPRRAGQALNQLEKIRALKKKGPGLYELEVIDQENDRGRWKDLRIKPIGNPPDDFAALALMWFESLNTKQVETHQEKQDASEAPF